METLRSINADSSPSVSGEPSGASHPPRMEVAHVLFMDIIGYSRLRMNQQAAAQLELQNLVNASAEVQQAKVERKFICRPAGDGMALLFFRDIVSPVRTALQIHDEMARSVNEIQSRVGVPLKMRMGIHSGTVLMVEDLNAQSDAAGDGINIAQRVMDCGDADHILLSSKVAESLLSADPWQRYLTDLGDCRVKHGVVVHLYLLHGRLDGPYYGNIAIPHKVQKEQEEMESEIKRYRGSIFERRPELKKQLITFFILALAVGSLSFAWLTVKPFKHAILVAYDKAKTGIAIPHLAKDAHKSASGAHAVVSRANHGESRHVRSGDGDSGSAQIKVEVPDLMGKTLEEAGGIAESDSLHVARSAKTGYNTQYGEGQIYEQSPAAGASVRAGTQVYVRISRGDPPDPTAAAPADSSGN